MADFNEKDSRFFAALVFAIIFAGVLFIFFVLLARPAEAYTELYFDLGSMKESAVLGAEHQFRFFVENREGRPVDYNYSVLLGSTEVKRGVVLLGSGEKKAVAEKVRLSVLGRQKVEVSLNAPKGKRAIFFWVNVGERR